MTVELAENILRIGSSAIPYELVRGRPNRVRLSFRTANTLCIETGTGNLGNYDREFLESKSQWILKIYTSRKQEAEQKGIFLENIENAVPVLGKSTPVEYFASRNTHFRLKPGHHYMIYGPKHLLQAHKKKLLYYSLRKFAEQYLPTRVDHWKQVCNLEINQLRIKDVRSKWGSCTSTRNINLNWQLVLLDETLIDYVVVHELMHLHEMNHSPNFWALVGQYIPQYKKLRNQLKDKAWLVGILK